MLQYSQDELTARGIPIVIDGDVEEIKREIELFQRLRPTL
jgi:hypothetical protein